MIERLKKQIDALHRINDYRKAWLFLSAFVVMTIIGIIFGWNYVSRGKFLWIASSMGLLVSMTWWYWTMRLIRHLISYKIEESKILEELVVEIQTIKKEVVKKFYH